ncbi:hypothetical protein FGO68_gene4034 [Halteria grandinella]|uniref:Uncharacterized protein n=1 Tax=Halteria grandinella TaxID=5974 RepID=A0A8J8NGZ8_HALGN|nr:hypothetical protein FGO68_gene4034 [Halteria grandinella]
MRTNMFLSSFTMPNKQNASVNKTRTTLLHSSDAQTSMKSRKTRSLLNKKSGKPAESQSIFICSMRVRGISSMMNSM